MQERERPDEEVYVFVEYDAQVAKESVEDAQTRKVDSKRSGRKEVE